MFTKFDNVSSYYLQDYQKEIDNKKYKKFQVPRAELGKVLKFCYSSRVELCGENNYSSRVILWNISSGVENWKIVLKSNFLVLD